MTVTVLGQSGAEIRQFVHEYYRQPYGTKAAWLANQAVPRWKFSRWRNMVFEGDVERKLIPRDHGEMTRTSGERSAFEKARSKEIAEHHSEVEELEDRVRVFQGSNTALGEAI